MTDRSGSFLVVPDWDAMQHYKNRNPTWIKLHRSLLTDQIFMSLSREDQGLLVLFWIVAARHDGVYWDDADRLGWVLRSPVSEEAIDRLVAAGALSRISSDEIAMSEGGAGVTESEAGVASKALAGATDGRLDRCSRTLRSARQKREREQENQKDSDSVTNNGGRRGTRKDGTLSRDERTRLFNELIWPNVPNQMGKRSALSYFLDSVKTREDVDKCARAVVNYAKRVAADEIDPYFIKRAPSLIYNWQDYIDAGNVD